MSNGSAEVVLRTPSTGRSSSTSACSRKSCPSSSGTNAVDAAIADESTVIAVVALVGSALTLLSMVKIWSGVFWGEQMTAAPDAPVERGGRRLMVGAAAAAVIGSLVISATAGGLWDLSERAATGLLDSSIYIDAVLS